MPPDHKAGRIAELNRLQFPFLLLPGFAAAGSFSSGVMAPSTFQSEFDAWLDGALSQPISPSVVAFNFNLAEPWCIEVVGSDRYSDDDPDWPCEESFRSGVERLSLPESEVGLTWELVLEEAKRLVSAYLDRPSAGSAVLRRAEAVAVGFVDGDIHRVWPR